MEDHSNEATEQNALNSLESKPLIKPKPSHLLLPPPQPITDHELKLESPERTGSPGDQTSRYVALISPATFNLGLKSPNGRKLFAVEIDEKSLLNNNNEDHLLNEDDLNQQSEVKDVNGNEETLRHQIEDKIIIESFEEKKFESPPDFVHSGISYEDDSDMSQELEPDSLEEIIIKVPDNLNSIRELDLDPSEKVEIILTPKNYNNYSDDETDIAPKKELVVPTIVLDRVDVDGKIVNCNIDEMNNVTNIQVTVRNVVQEESTTVEEVIQPVVVHVEASQPHKAPKKLFPEEEGDTEQTTEDEEFSVKDLEARKLRALERERRRIIDNQVVRRKKIDYWAFANTIPPEFSEDQLKALAHEKMGFEALAQVEIVESLETVIDGSQSPPPTPPPPPPGSEEVEIDQKEVRGDTEVVEEETRGELEEETEGTTPEIEVVLPALHDEDDNEILMSALVTEDGFIQYDEDGMPSLGAVDSASILENKERLRNFWEQRIMADQELKENGVSPPVSPTIVSLDGEIKDSTPTKAKSQEDVFKEAAVLEDCEPSPPDSLNEEVSVVNGIQDQESQEEKIVEVQPEPVVEEIIEKSEPQPVVEAAIVLGVDEGEEKSEDSPVPEKELDNSMEESALDREVRLALEREEQLKKERIAAESSPESSLVTPESEEQPEDFPVHHVALAPTVEESEEDEMSAGKSVETETKVIEHVKVMDTTEGSETVQETTTVIQTEVITTTKVQETIPTPKAILTPEPFNDEVVTVGEVIFVDSDGVAKQVEDIVPANKPQIIGETYRQQVSEESLIEVETTTQAPVIPTTVPAPKPSPTVPPTNNNNINNNNSIPVLLKNERPTYNPNSDSKIALEIREMKEREDELRIMRETILRENQNNAANKASVGSTSSLSNSSRQSEQGSVHSDDGNEKLTNGQNGINGSSSPVQNQITRTISLENLHPGQNYNIGYAFGHRRKDGVKVKPLADAEEDKQVFKVLKESPIEKEIRLAKEREDQLRREKGLLQDGAQRPQTLDVMTNGKLPASKTSPFQVPLKPVSANGDTQRILATSRIQQEIEEQTEREKALRATGKIQTISQERTDAKVAGSRLREINGGSPDSAVALSSSGHTPLSPSPSLSDSEKSSTHSSPAVNGNGVYTNGVNAKTPSPTNSTVSAGIKVNGNGFQAGRRFSNPPTGRNVNMQRFIASKGKEVTSAFSPFNSASKEKSQSVLSLHHVNGSAIDAYQMKPPKVPKDLKNGTTTNGTSPSTGLPKRSLTAESKIQEELKEMQAREDELRQQRARLLGLSQPNLTALEDEDSTDGSPQPPTNGHNHSSTNGSNGVSTLERASSNPNLLDDDVEFVGRNKKNMKFGGGGGGPRRRSTLIEQWEQRIQSSEAKS